jgi:hypothetical protein
MKMEDVDDDDDDDSEDQKLFGAAPYEDNIRASHVDRGILELL